MTRRPAVLDASLLAAVVFSGDGCSHGNDGVQIDNNPAFQLTYIDRTQQVRVRYSDDAESWTDGGLNSNADGGVGASSSPDVVGVSRVVADGGTNARLELWFGLGPATWDGTSVPFSNLRPRTRPTIVDMGDSRYLIAFLPLSGSSFELWLYDHGDRQMTQVPLSGGLGNSDLHYSPAMAFLPADSDAGRNVDRVALAWGRYENASSTDPYDIRTLYAMTSLSTGDIITGGGFFIIESDSLDSFNYFGPIPHLLSEPAMTHDHKKFILASHQRFYGVQPTNRASFYVRMHTSPEGRNWETGVWVEFTDGIYDDPGFLEFAIQPNCTGILTFVEHGSTDVHAQIHRPNGAIETLDVAVVFGSNLPSTQQFALITTGRPSFVPEEGCSYLNFVN